MLEAVKNYGGGPSVVEDTGKRGDEVVHCGGRRQSKLL
jgi:hypothetical protein